MGTGIEELAATKTVAAKTRPWAERAAEIKVHDEESYSYAGEALKVVKALRAEVEAAFGPIVKAAHATWKVALAQRAEADDPLDKAESILKRSMTTWFQAEEYKKLQEAKRQREELERIANEEREAELVEAEAQGASVEEVTAIAERPAYIPPVHATMAAPKLSGVATVKRWTFEVEDKLKLVKFVAANPQFLHLLDANETALGGLARSLRNMMAIPGVKAYEITGMSARRSG